MRRLLPLLCLLATPPAWAEPNRSPDPGGPPGPVAAYVAAARTLPLGLAAEDSVLVLAAVRLARAVHLRPATGWQADPEPAALPETGAGLPRDPGSAEAERMLGLMVEGDSEMQLAAGELMADPLPPRSAQGQRAGLAAGGSVVWTLPLYGQSPAEIGLLGLSGAPLALRVSDAAGAEICAPAPAAPVALCAFTPAENGWFRVEIANPDGVDAGYLLLTN